MNTSLSWGSLQSSLRGRLLLLLFVFVTQSVIFLRPCFAATNSIAPGQILSGSITSPSQTNFYSFTASSNDVVSIGLVLTNGAGNPRLTLYDPAGQVTSLDRCG